MEERLQKIIARAGVASRRHAEQMIASGMVTVNGQVVTELGTKADASRDHIKVGGKLLRGEEEKVYLLFHKPAEVVSTLSDPEGRRSVRDFLQGISARVFPMGRLEYHTSGLLLLTNDGDLANRFMSAHDLPQRYQIKLKTLLTFAEIATLSRSTGARVERVRRSDAPWYEVQISEARRDVLRNRLFQTGHPVEKMKRIQIGGLELGTVVPGEYREISAQQAAQMFRASAEGRPAQKKRSQAAASTREKASRSRPSRRKDRR